MNHRRALTSLLFVMFLLGEACSSSGGGAPQADAGRDQAVDAGAEAGPDLGGNGGIENGLYVATKVADLTLPLASPAGTLAQIIGRPYVHGISFQIGWADLEPTRGTYAPVVRDCIEAARSLSAAAGKKLTLKIHLRNGVVPVWLLPPSVSADAGVQPTVVTTTLGFRALAQPGANGQIVVTLVPTEPGYIARVEENAREVARQLDVADPNADSVRIVQVPGPSSESGGTMRLTPTQGFPRSGAVDAYGFGWTFTAHLDAWKAMGPLLAGLPAFQTRQWTFDLTHQVPKGDAQFGLSTADQMSVADALARAHPLGKSGIRLMNEGLSAQTSTPAYPATPKTCSWTVSNFDDPANLPESTIAAWPDHEWQIQAPAGGQYNMPRLELARCALFADPGQTVPSELQHTSFVEIHDRQALADGNPLEDGTQASAWYACFDSMLRAYAGKDAALDATDTAFWQSSPSLSSTCVAYPPTPPATFCRPIH
jgi:hypothetical protein